MAPEVSATTGAEPTTADGQGSDTTAGSGIGVVDGTVSTSTSTSTTTTSSTTSDDPLPPMDECDCGFISASDVPILECDLAAQDCERGMKCTIYIDLNVDEWMGSMCVSVVPEPVSLGGICTVEEHFGSGFDDCEEGAMCFYVDPETLQGTCVGFCRGPNPPWMFTCYEDGTTCRRDPIFGGPELLCLPECDPLAQDCPANQGCYALTVDGWFCEPTFGGSTAEPGDFCDDDTDCVPGSICSGSGSLAACETSGCCTPICEIAMDEQCPNYPAELCRPLSARLPQLGFCGE